MNIITFQFGQCGNQVGQSLYSYLYNDIFWEFQRFKGPQSVNIEYRSSSQDTWFTVNKRNQLSPRSVLVDTENKVTAIANKNTPYNFQNIVSGAYGGSANNWACGYNCKSSLLIGEILEATRKELEKCSFVKSFVSFFGAGGGTGSGLGCYAIEKLREEYPNKFIINCLILPHETGEVVTQNYNAVLTLAKLYDIADASVIFSNDLLFKICTKNLHVEEANFNNFNDVVSQQIAGVFQPVNRPNIPIPLIDLVAHPDYRFLNVHSAPLIPKEHIHYETPTSTNIILNQIERSLKSLYCELSQYNKSNCPNLPSEIKCIGNLLFTRGDFSNSRENFLNENAYVRWMPKEFRNVHFYQRRPLKDTDLSTTLISNNNICCYYLNSIIQDAWELFTNGAYLHHYKKFGVDEQDFLKAFEKLEAVLSKYQCL